MSVLYERCPACDGSGTIAAGAFACPACRGGAARAGGEELTMRHDDIPAGPAGRSSEGGPRGEDEVLAEIGASDQGEVMIDFGRPVSWLALPPRAARTLAIEVLKQASEIDGRPITLRIGG